LKSYARYQNDIERKNGRRHANYPLENFAMPLPVPTNTHPLFVNISVVAFEMNMPIGCAYNLVSQGKFPLPTYKVGRRSVYKYSDLIDWAEKLSPQLSSPKPELTITSATNVAIKREKGRPSGTTKVDLAAKRKRLLNEQTTKSIVGSN